MANIGKYAYPTSYLNERVDDTARFLFPAAFSYPESVVQAWGQSNDPRFRELSRHTYTVATPDDTGYNTMQSVIKKEQDNAVTRAAARYESNGVTTYIYPDNKTYKDYYWGFVNSKDTYEAAENFSKMLDKVTLDMEPAEGMASWVEEPKKEEVAVKSFNPVLRYTQILAFVVFINLILQLLGVTRW